jgi:recombination protein RecT
MTAANATSAQTPAEIGRAKIHDLRSMLEKMAPQLQQALPKHMNADRLARIALTAVQRVPKLLDCTQRSFAGALMTAAQLGLEPDGVIGQAYLIPRANRRAGTDEVVLQVGYKGLLELSQRSGQIGSISVRVVRRGDEFTFSYGLDDTLTHRPGDENAEAEVTHVYAIVRTKDGGRYFELMTRGQIEAHRRRYSKDGREDSAWNTAWEWMAKKTVLIQALKLAPKSIELAHAVAVEEPQDLIETSHVGLLDLDGATPEPIENTTSDTETTQALAELGKSTAPRRGTKPPSQAPAVQPATTSAAPESPPAPAVTTTTHPAGPPPGMQTQRSHEDVEREIIQIIGRIDALMPRLGRDVAARVCKESGASLGARRYGLLQISEFQRLLGACETELERPR